MAKWHRLFSLLLLELHLLFINQAERLPTNTTPGLVRVSESH